MVDVEQRGKQFGYLDGFGRDDQKRREAYFETRTKFLEFSLFIEKHRIYLPKKLCDSLAAFDRSLRESVNSINIFIPGETTSTSRFSNKLR